MEDTKVIPIKLNGLKVEVRPSDTKDGRDRELDKALKIFKKKVEKDGILFEMKDRKYYTKPSVIKRLAYKKLHPKKKRLNK